jgi:hypothetical protein
MTRNLRQLSSKPAVVLRSNRRLHDIYKTRHEADKGKHVIVPHKLALWQTSPGRVIALLVPNT